VFQVPQLPRHDVDQNAWIRERHIEGEIPASATLGTSATPAKPDPYRHIRPRRMHHVVQQLLLRLKVQAQQHPAALAGQLPWSDWAFALRALSHLRVRSLVPAPLTP